MKILNCGRKLCRLFNFPSFSLDIAFSMQEKNGEKLFLKHLYKKKSRWILFFMLLKKNSFSCLNINILQIKFKEWKALLQKCHIEYLMSHKTLSILLNVVFINQHIFKNISLWAPYSLSKSDGLEKIWPYPERQIFNERKQYFATASKILL